MTFDPVSRNPYAMAETPNGRTILIEEMNRLKELEITCSNCAGDCCTFKSNSMQISPPEAKVIRAHLEQTGRWSEPLVNLLRDCVNQFRLNIEIPRSGARANIRRTYTCPFFTPGPRGCSLPKDVKPLGCLAFNPVIKGATGLVSKCQSNQGLLKRADDQATPQLEKKPIPLALLGLLH
jgi:Fe-S-cluster containining protein